MFRRIEDIILTNQVNLKEMRDDYVRDSDATYL